MTTQTCNEQRLAIFEAQRFELRCQFFIDSVLAFRHGGFSFHVAYY
jgi:hypothetical protein